MWLISERSWCDSQNVQDTGWCPGWIKRYARNVLAARPLFFTSCSGCVSNSLSGRYFAKLWNSKPAGVALLFQGQLHLKAVPYRGVSMEGVAGPSSKLALRFVLGNPPVSIHPDGWRRAEPRGWKTPNPGEVSVEARGKVLQVISNNQINLNFRI